MDNEMVGDLRELPERPWVDIPEADLMLLERAARDRHCATGSGRWRRRRQPALRRRRGRAQLEFAHV